MFYGNVTQPRGACAAPNRGLPCRPKAEDSCLASLAVSCLAILTEIVTTILKVYYSFFLIVKASWRQGRARIGPTIGRPRWVESK